MIPKLGRMISIIYRQYQCFMRDILKEYDLGNTDYPVLLCVDNYPGINHNEIARISKMNKGLVSKSISKLLKNGYLIQEQDEFHKQKSKIYLAEKGKDILPFIRRSIDQWQTYVTEDFTEEEKKLLHTLMSKIFNRSLKIK